MSLDHTQTPEHAAPPALVRTLQRSWIRHRRLVCPHPALVQYGIEVLVDAATEAAGAPVHVGRWGEGLVFYPVASP